MSETLAESPLVQRVYSHHNASSIVAGDARATGVEFPGDRCHEYSSMVTKSITLVSTDSLPWESYIMKFTLLTVKIGLRARTLEVVIIGGAKVVSVNSDEATGSTILELTKRDRMKHIFKADLFLPIMNGRTTVGSHLQAQD